MRTRYSKLTTKSQTVFPKEVREKLGLKPGDRVRYRISEHAVTIEKAISGEDEDPFGAFSEWRSDADERAYAGF